MWTVVYISQNRKNAEDLCKALEAAGILVKMRTSGNEEEDCCSYEILVPETEIEEAHNIIIEMEL